MAAWSWVRKDGQADLMIDMARDLDALYAGRLIVAVGHSPSWLVYAVGLLRSARGQDANVAYIPHSGQQLNVDREQTYTSPEAGAAVRFGTARTYGASDGAVARYFNVLNRRGIAPEQIMARAGAEKPVLVDYIRSGDGLVSFLNNYDRADRLQGGAGIAGRVDIQCYKLDYYDQTQVLELPPVNDNEGPRRFDAQIKTGVAGRFFNALAGTRGGPKALGADDVTRFMPYYNLSDHYVSDMYATYQPPEDGLAFAKRNHEEIAYTRTALRAAVDRALNKPDEHAALSAQAADEVGKYMPEPMKRGWTSFYPGAH